MSMEMDHSFTVPVPPERAWDVLLDVEKIAPCMPGATVEEFDGEVVTGRIKVKVGPVSLTYRGTAKFTERDPDAKVIVLEASGKETRGAGTASATVRASLEPESSGEATKVTMHTTMNVTGRPAQFGRGVMVEVGGKLVEKFAENLAQLISPAVATETNGAAPTGDGSADDASGGPAAATAETGPGSTQPSTRHPRREHGLRSAGRAERRLHQPGQAGRPLDPQARHPDRHRRGRTGPARPALPAPVAIARGATRRRSRPWTSPRSCSAGTWCASSAMSRSRAESLDRILRNAVQGPSAGFSQGQAFLVLTGNDLKRFWEVADAAAAPSVTAAPLVIVPMSAKRVYLDRYARPDKGWTDRDEKRWPVPFWHIDTGMAALLILLTVVDEGLAALYFGIVPEAVGPFREAFGVPDDHEPIGAIAIGHDAEPAPRDLRSRRRPAQDVIHYGRW